jgi:hypothetical protein
VPPGYVYTVCIDRFCIVHWIPSGKEDSKESERSPAVKPQEKPQEKKNGGGGGGGGGTPAKPKK